MWRFSVALFVLFSPVYSLVQDQNPPANWTKIICQACNPGTHSTTLCGIPLDHANTSDPVCPLGQCILFDKGWANCSSCEPGSYQNEWGTRLCVPCEPGSYCSNISAHNCNPCPPGTYCRGQGSVHPRQCERGRYCPDYRMSEGTSCPKGYTCTGLGTINPLECAGGFYCEGGSALPKECPDNSYCPPGCTNCPRDCPLLFYAQRRSEHCEPTPVFYVTITLVFVFLVVTVAFFWIAASKKIRDSKEYNRSIEITSLIPKADGPKYTGL